MERNSNSGGGAAAASLRRLGAAVEGFAAQLQCAICLCAYANPSSLPCNHCFCEECIHRALELKPVCPICKAPAKKRKLRFDSMISQLLRATEALSAPPVAVAASAPAGGSESSALVANTNANEPETNGDAATVGDALEEKPPAPVEQHERAAESTSGPVTGASSEPAPPQALKAMTAHTSPSGQSLVSTLFASRGRRPTPERNAQATTASNCKQSELEAPPGANGTARAADSEVADSAAAAVAAPASNVTPPLNGPFTAGQLVQVAPRTWIGINKPGGAARITQANGDDTYNVKYVIDSRRELKIPDVYIALPSDELVADLTPSRAVKQRQRRVTTHAPLASDAALSEDQSLSPTRAKAASTNGAIVAAGKRKRSELVLLCSGYDDKGTNEIEKWSQSLGAEIVASWSSRVTHLVVKCVAASRLAVKSAATDGSDSEPGVSKASAAVARGRGAAGKRQLFSDTAPAARWVKIRSMKYLKALVGGRWIVSEEWLQARGEHVSETEFEADGHLKGRNIDNAVRRSRKRRQENLQTCPPDVDPSTIGTELFAEFCFHLVGDFLPPMPPQSELDTLLSIGGGQRIRALDDIAAALAANHRRRLVVVSDRINPVGLRDLAKHLRALPALAAVDKVAIVNYQWVLNSISEAKLRPLK